MALSPMMEHYLSVKEKYKDCVVFYRLGDFYEMFFDDAVRVSQLLDLTLTGRDCGLKERAPMCGIPYHAADGYIAKLVAMGERVAICEQLTEPGAGKMVERDVVRIVSAGTVTEESQLDEKNNNFIACACKWREGYALAWADITTGEFRAAEFAGREALLSFLVNLSAAEIICNDALLMEVRDDLEAQRTLPAFSCYLPQAFERMAAERTVLSQFGAASLEALGLSLHEGAVCAAGALLDYLKDTQKHALHNLTSVRFSESGGNMTLDAVAFRNLEILKNNAEGKRYGSLLWLLDRTKTAMGSRLIRQWLEFEKMPFCYLDGASKDRFEQVDRFNNSPDIPVFLISLKAGGTGLNLTSADYVIHYDPWWNPAVESQATDRTHRIGQTRQVFSYKLICENTVEEKILKLQEAKRGVADAIIPGQDTWKSLTREDLEMLFEV